MRCALPAMQGSQTLVVSSLFQLRRCDICVDQSQITISASVLKPMCRNVDAFRVLEHCYLPCMAVC